MIIKKKTCTRGPSSLYIQCVVSRGSDGANTQVSFVPILSSKYVSKIFKLPMYYCETLPSQPTA